MINSAFVTGNTTIAQQIVFHNYTMGNCTNFQFRRALASGFLKGMTGLTTTDFDRN